MSAKRASSLAGVGIVWRVCNVRGGTDRHATPPRRADLAGLLFSLSRVKRLSYFAQPFERGGGSATPAGGARANATWGRLLAVLGVSVCRGSSKRVQGRVSKNGRLGKATKKLPQQNILFHFPEIFPYFHGLNDGSKGQHQQPPSLFTLSRLPSNANKPHCACKGELFFQSPPVCYHVRAIRRRFRLHQPNSLTKKNCYLIFSVAKEETEKVFPRSLAHGACSRRQSRSLSSLVTLLLSLAITCHPSSSCPSSSPETPRKQQPARPSKSRRDTGEGERQREEQEEEEEEGGGGLK
jgi:hypothetical protein